VRGDIIDALSLQRANLGKAAKVIILADVSTSRTDAEIDARTVMANLTVKSVAPDAYTTAEILDPYLDTGAWRMRRDHLSREYSRRCWWARRSAGVTHVMHDLPTSPARRGRHGAHQPSPWAAPSASWRPRSRRGSS
jgi:hypothetical protein